MGKGSKRARVAKGQERQVGKGATVKGGKGLREAQS